MRREPSKWALNFLEWFCPDSLHETILGDLLEQFDEDVENYNPKVANRKFILNVLRFFRPGILLRNKFSNPIIKNTMISSYFKIASRNIMKRKMYSFINAFGLSIGIAFCILIYLYIQDEKNFDHFHSKKDRIYRIDEKSYNIWNAESEDLYNHSAYLPVPLRQVLLDEIPEVDKATRINVGNDYVVSYKDKHITEGVTYVDNDFFEMFSFPVTHGNKEKLLLEKNEVVFTSEAAEKFFENEDPIGKIVDIDINGTKSSFIVTGIIEKAPANSSIEYNILISQVNKPFYEQNNTQWRSFSTPTFVLLNANADLAQFQKNLEAVVAKHMSANEEKQRQDHNIPADIDLLKLMPTALTDIHLNKQVSWHKVSDPQYSLILGGIAILILLIACINYIALALTTSTSRRIEVGVRKAIGANKGQLFSQFGFESIALAFFSLIIAFGLVALFINPFNEFTQKGIALTTENILEIAGFGILLTLVIGFLAGSYPAIFLSSFKPVQVLKGGNSSKLKAGFTKPLVVLQFALSAFLMISSVIMYQQMKYITTKDLGFEKDQVLVIPTQKGWNEESNKLVERFRHKMSMEPDIISIGGTSASFNQGWSRYGYEIDGEMKKAFVYAADPYYIPTLGITLLEGRNFDPAIASDSSAVIINEALAKDMGWKNPLEEHLNWREDSLSLGAQVIGVMKDYNFQSLQNEISPMFISMDKQEVGYLTTILAKVKSNDMAATIEKIQTVWKDLAPDKPLEYTFLDQDVARQYESHQRWMSIMTLSTAFALLISCLGLFGLAGINAVNKTKEIGIRKVMGAEIINIFILLNRQYVYLALLAFVLAAPLSWYVMQKWLSDFQYSITMGWHLFAISMTIGLIVALLTVSYHAVKASMINPADTLKYE